VGANVNGLGEDVELSYGGSEFQFDVGDGSVWVASGDEAFVDGGGPAATPEHGQDVSLMDWDKVYPSQANTRGVARTASGRGNVRKKIRDLSRSRAQVFDKQGKFL
jgi:hypothetical protein